MSLQYMFSQKELENQVNIVNKIFDLSKLSEEKVDKKDIQKYYKSTRWAYKYIYNKGRGNFKHMAISPSATSKYNPEDLKTVLTIIQRQIDKNHSHTILELGAGDGPNSYYLAKNNPDKQFYSVDLSTLPIKKFQGLPNYQFYLDDFHKLDKIKDNSIDLVFVIEALCHSDNKNIVLELVRRKLKKNGLFIIFDAYTNKDTLTRSEKQILQSTERSMAVNSFENIKSFEQKIKESGFKTIHKQNLNNNIIPGLKRLKRISKTYFELPDLLFKTISTITGPIITQNSIAGYLLLSLILNSICVYELHILQK